jgi:hypothetical protein
MNVDRQISWGKLVVLSFFCLLFLGQETQETQEKQVFFRRVFFRCGGNLFFLFVLSSSFLIDQ